MENEHVTALMNEFIRINNLKKIAVEEQDYEQGSLLRDKEQALQKLVFDNIVLPHIPISVEYRLKK